MKVITMVSALCAFLFLATGNAYAQWAVVEDFESGVPEWHSVYDDWTGADPLWRIKTEASNHALNHAYGNNGGLYGMTYVACKIYPVATGVAGEVKINYKSSTVASGYGTMACVVLEGLHNATDVVSDYGPDGIFNTWKPVTHSREPPHTVGTYDGNWYESAPVAVDTTGVQSLTVCFAAVVALGTTYEGYFDDLQFSENLIPEVSGVECWEIYK